MSQFVLADTRTGEVCFDGIRVNRGTPCPICKHDTWCLFDGVRGLAICPRTQGGRKIGDAGWLHDMVGGEVPKWQASFQRPPDEVMPLEGAMAMQEKFTSRCDDRVAILAFDLGLSVRSLERLGCGWNGLWTFPMRNHREQICGFRTRTSDGRKLAIKGSRAGLFVPEGRRRGLDEEVWIVEGPTDVAAMLDIGLNAIGRPSCRGSEKEIKRWCIGMRVIVVADADEVGVAGAESLIQTLRGSVRRVEMILPPRGMKDAREALNHGISSDEWRELIDVSESRRSTNGPTR
jgi:hypothetical protein